MEKVASLIPKYLMTRKTVVALGAILLGIWCVFWAAGYIVDSSVTTWKGACTFQSWDVENKRFLRMVVDCGEKGTRSISDDKVFFEYLTSPGPLSCEVDRHDDISCYEVIRAKE